MTTVFAELGLGSGLVRALEEKGYSEPTAIQAQAIPEILRGSDVLATAQTGTGKTASFALPMLQLLSTLPLVPSARSPVAGAHTNEQRKGKGKIRALVLTPTRELAAQVNRNIKTYSANLRLRSTVLVGGVPIHAQRRKLNQQPQIVVATPGRLMDLLQQKVLTLADVEILILDEADRMLDMGFIKDVRKIVAQTPKSRQTLFFSATMSKEVTELSRDILHQPTRIEVAPSATIADNLTQSVYFIDKDKKRDLLTALLGKFSGTRVLVFTRTKHRANRLAQQLTRSGITADAIHSNKSQNARRRTLAAFDRGTINVLVATDVVARGIDVKDISHVINYELPNDAENYVHRIGRTARAQQSGYAFSFCDSEEVGALQAIERLTKQKLEQEKEHAFHSELVAARYLKTQSPRRTQRGRGARRNRPEQFSSSKKRTGTRRNHRRGQFRRSASSGGGSKSQPNSGRPASRRASA